MNRFKLLGLTILAVLGGLRGGPAPAAEADLPNILWITCEDIGPQLGCYGDTYAQTPNLDRLAGRGTHYLNAWSNAPVCAPARTTIITGVYPTSLGAEHMRSQVAMPAFIQMYPQLLRQRGYYCTNNNKEDYNVEKPGPVWDESSGRAHWKNRRPGQPFFAVFNILCTHESQIRARPHTLKHDPAKARVPAYHPDTPEVRHDWAQYYDNITEMDALAGRRIEELEKAGLMDRTIVFFYGDHGSGMPRSKRWPYDSGLHVPLIVYVPQRYRDLATAEYRPGGASERLVSFVDLAPTLLSLAGMRPPQWIEGHAFLGKLAAPPQPYLFGFRGRMDERYDLVRSVRNGRYVYIRNFMPHLIYGQYINYMFQTPTTRVWRELYDQHKLRPPQTCFWEPKPAEELYDLAADRDKVHNLADSSGHQAIRAELRKALHAHLLATRDAGFLAEDEQHGESSGTTIYELAHDRGKYPLEQILDMAELASSRRPGVTGQLAGGLKSPDSGVRYWAAVGALVRGGDGVEALRGDLRRALADPSPSVRITAAWALGQDGSPADVALALPVLEALAPPVTNGVYTSLLALSAMDALGPRAASLHEMLRTMEKKDPQAPGRANGYVARLVERILGSKE